MGYHVVDPDELDPEPDRPSEMRYVSEAAGMEHLGLRVYRVDPGEEITLSGTLSVETPEEVFRVEAGQFFVAEPGSPHRAHVAADADESVEVVGMGAPPQSDGHAYEG